MTTAAAILIGSGAIAVSLLIAAFAVGDAMQRAMDLFLEAIEKAEERAS